METVRRLFGPSKKEIWRQLSAQISMVYMIIEHVRDGDPCPVHGRFRGRGRLAPEGLHYVP